MVVHAYNPIYSRGEAEVLQVLIQPGQPREALSQHKKRNLVVPGFELRMLCLLGRQLDHLSHTSHLFCLEYFGGRFALTVIFLFYISHHSWNDRHMSPHPVFWFLFLSSIEMESCQLFTQTGLKMQSSLPEPPT
jgi:hypothetical protein